MSVVTFPTGIDVAGKNAVWFVPTLADPSAPKITELQAGFPIHCAIYEFVPKGEQTTTTEDRYCLATQIESLGKTKYSVDPLKYVYDPQKPTDAEGVYMHYGKLTPGLSGYLVDRRGIGYEVAFSAEQYVDIIPVTLGVRNRTPIEASAKDSAQKYTAEQSVAVSGEVRLDVKLAA